MKPIPGFEDYLITDDGRIFSAKRGHVRELNPFVGAYDYLFVNVLGKVRKQMPVHRAILLAYVGPAPDGMEARHLDGNKRHNALDNLKWGTPLEQAADRRAHGTDRTVSDDEVREMNRLFLEGRLSKYAIARRFKIHITTVQRYVTAQSSNKGSRNANARFTEAQVLEMRKLAAEGIELCEIAQRFEASQASIKPIIRNKSWVHVHYNKETA